jgi:HD superfamily phosphodiesterase
MDYINIPRKAENFVRELFAKNTHQPLVYHNLEHTTNVVDRAREIAAQYELTEIDQIVLFTSAWFHDTGHLFVDPAMHEVKSVDLMKGFMSGYSIDNPTLIQSIEDCILATRMVHTPENIVEQIIRDADTYHLGTKDFKSTNKKIRKEYILRKLHSPHANWNKKSLEFLESHVYHTQYCQTLLDEGKQKNIQRLKKKALEEELEDIHVPVAEKKETEEESKESNRKNSLLNKGIQTMLRLTSDNLKWTRI